MDNWPRLFTVISRGWRTKLIGSVDKKHDLMVEDLSTGSNWQAGLPWMKLGTEDMPLSPYKALTITIEVEELIEEECFNDVSPIPEP